MRDGLNTGPVAVRAWWSEFSAVCRACVVVFCTTGGLRYAETVGDLRVKQLVDDKYYYGKNYPSSL